MEDVIQMLPMLVLSALGAAWLGDVTSSRGGYGFMTDLGVGLAGSVIAGGLVWATRSAAVGMFMMFLTGGVGGALAIAAQRRLWGTARPWAA